MQAELVLIPSSIFDIFILRNNFVEVSKNLVKYRSKNNFVELSKLYYYVERSSIINNAKSFDILTTNLSVLHNYFNGPNKIIFRFVYS